MPSTSTAKTTTKTTTKATPKSPPKKRVRVPKIRVNPIEHRNSLGKVIGDDTVEFIQRASLLTPQERSQLLTPSERVKAARLKSEVEEQVKANLGKSSSLAFDNLLKLAKTAESEAVRLKANIHILDMAGFKPVEKIQHIKAPRSPEEVEAELVSIVGKETAEVLLGKRKLVN